MTKTLKIEDTTARKLYKDAAPEFKALLEENFGKDFFSTNITDRVKTWDDVLEISGKDENDILPYRNPINKQQRSQNALAKIQLITDVLNEGTVFDFNNRNQPKYYPYFEKTPSGWVLVSCSRCYGSVAGAGQHFKSSELAMYAGNTFIDIYREYLPG